MNFNNFTIKAQEVVQKAVQLTRTNGHQAIEPEHLLKAIIAEGDTVVRFIFQKLDISLMNVERPLEAVLQKLPHVSGGEPYLSNGASQVLDKANDIASKNGDQYVTVEAMLMALFEVKSTASTILKDAGMTRDDLKAAIDELRKGKNATSQSAEEQYNALSKYAVNLNERARQGKLDPVIGRDDEIRRVLPPHQKQPHPDWRTGYGKDGYRRRISPTYRAWRCTREPEDETSFLSRYGRLDCRR